MTRVPGRIPLALAILALAFTVGPVAAAPAAFHQEVVWTVSCGDHGSLDLRSAYSNGRAWTLADGSTALMVAAGSPDDDVSYGPRMDKTALAASWTECTVTSAHVSGDDPAHDEMYDAYFTGWWAYLVFPGD